MAPKRKAKAPASPPPAAAATAEHAGPSQARPKEPATKRRRVAKEYAIGPAADCFAFGTNPFGALGLGEDTTEAYRPAIVSFGGKKAVQVSCGGMHTVALAEDGSVYSWGVNDEGALGRPTSGSAWEDKPDAKEDSTVPGLARLPAGVHIVQVAAGDGFTFALADDGAIWGWGCFKDDASGTEGFPGVPKGAKRAVLPLKVYEPAGPREKVQKIAAGARHMSALTRRRNVLTWGFGAQGQLGRVPRYDQATAPPLEELLTPKEVPNINSAHPGDVTDIACGAYSTFAVVGRPGAVVAWGLNNAGQLGIPKQQMEQQQQQQGQEGGQQPPQQQEGENFLWEPTHVETLSGIAAVAGGEHHSLALGKKGQLLSFGAATYGMLGREGVSVESSGEHHPPAAVAAEGGLGDERPVAVAAGTNVSGCVTKEGNVFLWGSNVNYQMAKGSDDSDNVLPARMRRTAAFGRRSIVALSFGGQHGALLALEEQPAPAAAANGVA